MQDKLFRQAKYVLNAAQDHQWPRDTGFEVAIVGRSNVGKSTSINVLTGQKKLARTSKTPGRTQHIIFFELDESRRLVDLPGYGYAKVPLEKRQDWEAHISRYLAQRKCLKGIVLLMDSRHPLTDLDKQMLDICVSYQTPTIIMLTKTDKLSKNQYQQAKFSVEKQLKQLDPDQIVQQVILFSGLNKQGLDDLNKKLQQWYDIVR